MAAIRHTWGFDKPIYDQYLLAMKNVFTGKVTSYTQQVNVEQQIRQGLPATLSLAIGAGIIWLVLRHAARAGGRGEGRQGSRTGVSPGSP